MTIESTIKAIETLSQSSAASWETAVETAGPEYDGGSEKRAAQMQSLADACEAEYDAAIDAIREHGADWQSVARGHLEDAKRLESEGGDSADAISALEALEEYIEEDAQMVTIEEMPEHLRSSHREAGNWGVYPVNGATRRRVSRDEADEIVAADEDQYDHIVA